MRPPDLPSQPEDVRATRALVLAPHYDDEVLGCGGLLAALLGRGTQVHVAFLTDSSGGRERRESAGAGENAYAQRRAREARSVADLLDWQQTTEFGFEDGSLHARRRELAGRIEELLQAEAYDLVLAPSPLENSHDHRAAAWATWRALHQHCAKAQGSDMALLYYEVNQPLLPNLLVDVSRELDRLRQGMELYASQQEQHDYRAAALGLRRFRALPLSPSVEAAEGYLRLEGEQLATLGWDEVCALVRGDTPRAVEVSAERPTVSVVVRTKDRPKLLQLALSSLARSTVPPAQVVVVNDGGAPPELPSSLPFAVERVHHDEARGRAAAANAGVAACTAQSVAFLDDDDIVLSDHFEVLTAALAAPGVDAAYSDAAVVTFELAPPRAGWTQTSRRLAYSRDFDRSLLLLDNYIPFHTLLARRSLFREVGPFDTSLEIFEDWDFLIRLTDVTSLRHLRQVTCEYRHFVGHPGHALAGISGADQQEFFLTHKAKIFDKHREALSSSLLADAVVKLRRESVEWLEELRATTRKLAHQEQIALEVRQALETERDESRSVAHVWDVERAGLRQQLQILRDRVGQLEESTRRGEAERQRLVGDRDSFASQLQERDRQLQEQYDYSSELQHGVTTRDEQLARRDEEVASLHEQIGDLTLRLQEEVRLVEAMEATRAWRLHRAVERLRGRAQ